MQRDDTRTRAASPRADEDHFGDRPLTRAPSRRDVLAAFGAAGLLASAMPGAVRAAEPARRPAVARRRPAPLGAPLRPARTARDLKKAVKLGMVAEDLPLRDKFQLLVDLGFDGVELDSPSDLDHDEVLAAKEATGLLIPGVVDSVHWRQTLSDPDPAVRAQGREGLLTALRDAHAYGASTVLLVPGVVNPSVRYDEAWDRSLEELREVVPVAEELGVAIAFENVWNNFLLSPLEAARYVDTLESSAVGWYLDIGNLVKFGWPEQWVPILGERILKLDIKDYMRGRAGYEGFDVLLGEGSVDWHAVMTALDDIGYTGWGTAEVRGGDRTRLADIAARMDKLFAA